MKYWRGYLTAGVLAFFSWALMEFAKNHTKLVDMFYPYVTRMVQNTFAQWTGSVDYILWQLVLTLFFVLILGSVVLMLVLRWNPIQWFGWILAVAAVPLLLHTGFYQLNDYAGPMADDLGLTRADYTIAELETAAIYYRDRANALSSMVAREENGDVRAPGFEEIAEAASAGFQKLAYEQSMPIFYGTALVEDRVHWSDWKTLPIKKLGWTDWFTSVGVTAMHTPLTGEIAVNPQIPGFAMPFVMCREMAHRLSIANQGDAEFAAYLACQANPSPIFQYSGCLMAYRSCVEALESMPGTTATQALKNVTAGEGENVRHDLAAYDLFFIINRDEERVQTLQKLQTWVDDAWYNVRDFLSIAPLSVDTDTMYDLLVSWHIQEVVLPQVVPDEDAPKFDPYDEEYVEGLVDLEGNAVVEEPAEPEDPGMEE